MKYGRCHPENLSCRCDGKSETDGKCVSSLQLGTTTNITQIAAGPAPGEGTTELHRCSKGCMTH